MSDSKAEPVNKNQHPEKNTSQDADNQASGEFARFFTGLESDPVSWIGLGLEGCLARAIYDGEGKPVANQLGAPVPLMVERLYDWQRRGLMVKIVTPLASTEEGVVRVRDWLVEHGLPGLPVTNAKDLHMLELWDARCVQVIPNTGVPVGQSRLSVDRKKTDTDTERRGIPHLD